MQQLRVLEHTDLARICGGDAGAGDNSFGRCGPGSQWQWLGNVYTPECATHDAAVRGQLAEGTSHVMAHFKALPLLPAAVGSYFRARFGKSS